MPALTDYAETKLLNHMFRNVAYTPAASMQARLFSAAPTDAYVTGSPTGTELTGNGYASATVVFGAPAANGSTMEIANSAPVVFPTATGGDWLQATHVGIFEGGTNNLLSYGALTAPITILSGQAFNFSTGMLKVNID